MSLTESGLVIFKIKQLTKIIFLSSLSGGLLALAFPYPSLSFLGWLALSFFFLGLYRAFSLKEVLLSGFIFGFVFFGGLLYWMLVFGYLAWFSLTTFMALWFCLFAGGAYFIAKNYFFPARLFLISAWWVAVEFIRSFGPWGFGWGILAASQQSLVFLQLAKLMGAVGLSYLIVMVNWLWVEMWEARRNLTAIVPTALAVGLILILAFGLGWLLLGKAGEGRFYRVAAVQGNISQSQKFDWAYQKKVEETYLRLTKKAAERNSYLIIWPESAVPGYWQDEVDLREKLSYLAQKYKAYLLIGSLDWRTGKYYNSAFLISPEKEIAGRYDKLHLVPFGEFVPCRPLFGRLKPLAAVRNDLSGGRKLTVFDTKRGKFSVLICFESSEPFLSRLLVRKGARLLVAITNDGWFGRSAAARQHLELTRLRAIENGVYVVQAANTGLSAIIDPWGRIKKISLLLQKKCFDG